MENTTLIAALKEIGRLVIFALPGALILLFTDNPEIAGTYGIPILFILRAIDKGIHENKEIESRGILPF